MSVAAKDRLLEHAVLTTILSLHPERLSSDELVREIAKDQCQSDEAIRQTIRDLIGSSILHPGTDIVEPTRAVVRTAEILDRS